MNYIIKCILRLKNIDVWFWNTVTNSFDYFYKLCSSKRYFHSGFLDAGTLYSEKKAKQYVREKFYLLIVYW